MRITRYAVESGRWIPKGADQILFLQTINLNILFWQFKNHHDFRIMQTRGRRHVRYFRYIGKRLRRFTTMLTPVFPLIMNLYKFLSVEFF